MKKLVTMMLAVMMALTVMLPLTATAEEPVTISFFDKNSGVRTFDDPVAKELEKRTGIKLDLILPNIMSVYNMILIRSYIESMPSSLFEAVRIDGGNDLVIFFKIILPLAKPILMTVALFVAITQWNSWFDAYLYTSSQDLKPMQSILVEILNQYQTGASTSQQMAAGKTGAATVTPDSIRMAATMVATLPIIMVYPFIQKYFVKGIMLGAVKG